MRHTTIIAAALAAVLITGTAPAFAGDRVAYVDVYGNGRQDGIGDPRNTVADGIVGRGKTPDIIGDGGGDLPPATDIDDPLLVGKTPEPVVPGVVLDPTIIIDFSPDGHDGKSAPISIKLACVTAAPDGVKIVNVGDEAVPAGLKLRWSFRYAGGKVVLAHSLKAGKAVLVEGYEGHSKGKACGIKLLS